MEIAKAQVQRPEKGEDDYLVRFIDDIGSIQLLAVADGLSGNSGKAAAKWVIDCLHKVADTNSPRSIFNAIKQELKQSQARQLSHAEFCAKSTLEKIAFFVLSSSLLVIHQYGKWL
jgi:serine/threonine protein phosphatase PrpC